MSSDIVGAGVLWRLVGRTGVVCVEDLNPNLSYCVHSTFNDSRLQNVRRIVIAFSTAMIATCDISAVLLGENHRLYIITESLDCILRRLGSVYLMSCRNAMRHMQLNSFECTKCSWMS